MKRRLEAALTLALSRKRERGKQGRVVPQLTNVRAVPPLPLAGEGWGEGTLEQTPH